MGTVNGYAFVSYVCWLHEVSTDEGFARADMDENVLAKNSFNGSVVVDPVVPVAVSVGREKATKECFSRAAKSIMTFLIKVEAVNGVGGCVSGAQSTVLPSLSFDHLSPGPAHVVVSLITGLHLPEPTKA